MGVIKSAWQIWWGQWTWPLKLASVVFALLVLLVVFVGIRGCGRKPITIDQESVNKINSANERDRKAELQKVIEDNADVVKTVDNRSAIAETNAIERNRLIDERVKEADEKIEEAKRQGKDVTGPELECILTGNCR